MELVDLRQFKTFIKWNHFLAVTELKLLFFDCRCFNYTFWQNHLFHIFQKEWDKINQHLKRNGFIEQYQ